MALFDFEIYLRAALRLARPTTAPRQLTDILLCLVDHFEPSVGAPPREIAQARLQDWLVRYPQIAGKHRDADGRPPAHSFFYPWDEYDEWEFCRLADMCGAGWGEIDLHLHHRDDTSATLTEKLRTAIQLYDSHGVLPRWPDGKPAWGFIHGNWALDNSRSDGRRNYCGVNDELTLLAQEGCYADFTFPAWQHTAQPRQLNSIYYATDDPHLPKSYDTGVAAKVGVIGEGTLLLIQGPLTPFLRKGYRPAMDDGDLASYRRYSPERLDRWVRTGVHVEGRPDRVFVKLHCHGAADANREALLGSDLEALFRDAEARYNDGTHYRLHYVTAREMFNIVKATEAGFDAKIDEVRDYILKRPTGG